MISSHKSVFQSGGYTSIEPNKPMSYIEAEGNHSACSLTAIIFFVFLCHTQNRKFKGQGQNTLEFVNIRPLFHFELQEIGLFI